MFARYAIYFTPSGALARAGAAWLGRDIATGKAVAHPVLAGLDPEALTAIPRKYGMHATLKPPFHLADGQNADRLRNDLITFCAGRAPVRLEGLDVRGMGRFLALRPVGDQTELSDLAAQIVRGFDRYRAAPGPAELARRRQHPLTPAQEHNLADWGYPYVMDQFRFHITLTGPMDGNMRPAARALAAYFAPHLPAPFMIDALTLAGEDTAGRFHEILRVPLSG